MTSTVAKSPEPEKTTSFKAIAPGTQLVIPCLSAVAERAVPIKAAGSRVARGELLFSVDTAQPHLPLASRSGTITGVSRIQLTEDTEVSAVLLDIDATPPDAEPVAPAKSAISVGLPVAALADLTRLIRAAGLGEWIDLFRSAGIWADRWGSPDLIGQLHQSLSRPVDTVVCNLLDEDPAVALQTRVAVTWPTEVLAGVAGLASLCGAGRSWAVVPQGVPPATFASVKSACESANATLIPFPNPYPQSHPSLLVHELTGRHLSPGRLPVEQGVLLLDGAAAAAVGRYFLSREPMLALPLGLYDMVDRTTRFVVADIGMHLPALLAEAGMNAARPLLRAGAPLRDMRFSASSVVHGGELTIYASPDPIDVNPNPCIRCAWCVEACPVRIQPAGLLEAAQRKDLALAEEYGLSACIQCGICSYVCPSHLPLLRGIQTLTKKR